MGNIQNLKSFSEFEKIWEAEVAYQQGALKADQKKIDVLENKLKEYWGLSSDIDAITKEIEELLQKKLGALPDKLKGVQVEIEKDIESLQIQKIKTDKVVATFRKAYKQPTVSYKPMWETALTKVNENTRKVLEALVSQFTKETEVKQKIDIKRENLEVNEGIVDNIRAFFKKGIDYVMNLLSGGLNKAQAQLPEMQAATEELDSINQQIAGYEEKEKDREIPRWQASQYEAKKPSAGLSKKKKSAVAKKARKGGDIGKPGKKFKEVEAKAKKSGVKDPKAVAAAAMWKNIKR